MRANVDIDDESRDTRGTCGRSADQHFFDKPADGLTRRLDAQ
jgi:hypothetical protein